MKFFKFILAIAASFLILSQAGAATIVGNLMDIYGGGIDRTIKISPKSTPQAVIYNGTNYTVMDLAKTVSSTNSIFAVVLLGGIYNVDFGTVNGVATPVTKILVPPYDTNTYSFNYVANLATNLGTFVWTNSYGIAAGTNIVITTNGALLVINASAPAAAVPTNFASITVTNDINRGDASDTGKPLNISLGGSAATSPGSGGDGGTVNIGSGVNGNGLAGLGGNGGTVSIAQGGTSGINAVSGGNGGTVNIANASSKGTAGTVNIATNGSTYIGNLYAQSNIFANWASGSSVKNTSMNKDGFSVSYQVDTGGGPAIGSTFSYNSLSIGGADSSVGTFTSGGLSVNEGTSSANAAAFNKYGMTFYSDNLSGNPSLTYDQTSGNGLLTLAGTIHSAFGEFSGAFIGGYTGGAVFGVIGNGVDNTLEADYPHFVVNADHSVTANGALFNSDNTTTFSTNVYIASNLYITNHAYDVSTSRLDPLANEFVTAEYVQSVMAANFDLYFSTNSSGIFITNVGTPSTMVLANPINSQTNTISSWTNGTYFASRLQTNSISYIQSVPINLYTYVQITGGGSVTAHPEMWLYNTNGTIAQLGYSSDNEYSSSIAVPVNLSIALTNTAYLNVNLTNSPKLLLRWYVTSVSGNPTWKFLIGNGNVAHITVGTIPSANQNYVGTFTGNGTGLTNIPATGIVGTAVTNNANATFTGLSVGAQTALDVNGNGKLGGVTHTNGLFTATSVTTPTLTVSTNLSISGNLTASSITFTNLTGDGSGLTNIPAAGVVSTNVVTWIDCSQFINYVYTKYLQADGSLPTPFSATTVYYYPFAQTTYAGPYYRLTPQMTGGYTNIAFTTYLIASNTTYLANMAIEFRANECTSTNQQYIVPNMTVGTLTNGCNSRTGIVKINPNFKGNPYFVSGSINTGGNQFTNTVWLQGIKIEAY